MKKTICSLLVCVLLLTLFAGCESKEQQEESIVEQQETVTEETAVQKPEKVTLSEKDLLMPDGMYMGMSKEEVRQYLNENKAAYANYMGIVEQDSSFIIQNEPLFEGCTIIELYLFDGDSLQGISYMISSSTNETNDVAIAHAKIEAALRGEYGAPLMEEDVGTMWKIGSSTACMLNMSTNEQTGVPTINLMYFNS